MSPVALTLNLALGALLIGALLMGLRLDRRLKALRDSHGGFAKAVSELDQAALRTEAGLAELKATAQLARTDLAERIDMAQRLSERLAKLIVDAEEKTAELARHPLAPRAAPAPPQALPLQVDMPLDIVEAWPANRSTRSRAVVDDDLFESAKPTLSAMAGNRR
jgi:hypothetical protein